MKKVTIQKLSRLIFVWTVTMRGIVCLDFADKKTLRR